MEKFQVSIVKSICSAFFGKIMLTLNTTSEVIISRLLLNVSDLTNETDLIKSLWSDGLQRGEINLLEQTAYTRGNNSDAQCRDLSRGGSVIPKKPYDFHLTVGQTIT